jgi:hypothetical protein
MSNINGCSTTAPIKLVNTKYIETDLSCDKYDEMRNRFDNNDKKTFADLFNKPELANYKLTTDKLVRYTYGNANGFSFCTKLYE